MDDRETPPRPTGLAFSGSIADGLRHRHLLLRLAVVAIAVGAILFGLALPFFAD